MGDVAATHYEVLGLDYDAGGASIVGAYRSRKATLEVARLRADGAGRNHLDAELITLEEAYSVLSDRVRREEYDAVLADEALEADGPSLPLAMTLKDFYKDDARSRSREVDFGSS